MGKRRKSDEYDPRATPIPDRAEHGCVYEDEYPEDSEYLAWLSGDLDQETGVPLPRKSDGE